MQLANDSLQFFGKPEEVNTSLCQLSNINEIKSIYSLSTTNPNHLLTENICPLLVQLQKKNQFTHICGPISSISKTLFPRLSACLNTDMLSNILYIDWKNNIYTQPTYANNIHIHLKHNGSIAIFSLRPTSYSPIVKASELQTYTHINKNKPIIPMEITTVSPRIQFINIQTQSSERPDYSVCPAIVVGGRGMGSKDAFKDLYILADKLKGNVGGTRGAVDNGYISNTCQVGQTGKYISPEVYIGVGVSGAAQHLAGMKDSHVIFAVNKDSQANIFKVCDYGLVGDAHTVIPELNKLL
ncbi:hypothetical protein WA158_003649 [Blastocystis sp. Blastoise]